MLCSMLRITWFFCATVQVAQRRVHSCKQEARTPASYYLHSIAKRLRFSYLPVSLPALRGGSGRDAEKGEVDWGLIQNLKDESNEQSNVFSKIASFLLIAKYLWMKTDPISLHYLI